MASPSNTASSSNPFGIGNSDPQFDVFINYRGPDTKNTFASHLYHGLRQHELRVFLDRESLQTGDELIPQIEGAIKTASVHIAIFSPGYAQSSWCLDELVLMCESRKPILPVFYNVKPSHLRWNGDGGYGRDLRMLEKKKTFDHEAGQERRRHDSATIEKWKRALFNVADMRGFELQACNGDEVLLVKKVAERVVEMFGLPLPSLQPHDDLEGAAASETISLLHPDDANGSDIELGLPQRSKLDVEQSSLIGWRRWRRSKASKASVDFAPPPPPLPRSPPPSPRDRGSFAPQLAHSLPQPLGRNNNNQQSANELPVPQQPVSNNDSQQSSIEIVVQHPQQQPVRNNDSQPSIVVQHPQQDSGLVASGGNGANNPGSNPPNGNADAPSSNPDHRNDRDGYVHDISSLFATCHGAILAVVALITNAPVSSSAIKIRFLVLLVSALVSAAIIGHFVVKSYKEYKSQNRKLFWATQRIALFLMFIMISVALCLASNWLLKLHHPKQASIPKTGVAMSPTLPPCGSC